MDELRERHLGMPARVKGRNTSSVTNQLQAVCCSTEKDGEDANSPEERAEMWKWMLGGYWTVMMPC